MSALDLSDFLNKHQLPQRYSEIANQWFSSLAASINAHQSKANKPIVIGINGAQGSGKSTLTDLLVHLLSQQYGHNVIGLSIDDFYLTKQQRQQLSNDIHPLFITRGVPATHDVELAIKTIESLLSGKPTSVPRFNKAIDDRYPQEQWDTVNDVVDIIILEGWCVGAEAVDDTALNIAVNELEQEHDKDGKWRRHVNTVLASDYPALFDMVDQWVMLKAPSFNCVYNWRLEQEQKLRATLTGDDNATMSDQEIAFFIQHYQRITETILQTLPSKVDYLFELNTDRDIVNSICKDD